jgi:hypothetical protein
VLNGLSLFSGIGGIDLALSEWVRPVAYCEIEPYAAGVLFSRMSDGSIPTAPIWPDVRSLTARVLPSVDIIYGGFPCQDISTAGARKGLEGERSGLFFEAVRLIRECKPQFVFFENVPGVKKYVPAIRANLEAIGYKCRDGFAFQPWTRWFLLAKAKGFRLEGLELRQAAWETFAESPCQVLGEISEVYFHENSRNDHELPRPMDRIKCLGNAVMPIQAKEAFKRLMGISTSKGVI